MHSDVFIIHYLEIDKKNTADYEPLIIQNPIEYFKNNPQWLLIDDTIKVVLNDINIEHNE